MRRGLLLLAIGLTATAGSAVRAQEPQVRAANQLRAWYDTNVNESLVDDRLDLAMNYKNFSAGIVFLSHNPSDYLKLDQDKYGPHQEGIRKRWVTGSYGPWEIRLGDSYATFGSGIVLRIFEDQTVSFDNVVDGAHIQYAQGPWTVEGITGTNTYNEASTMVKGLSGRFEPAQGWLFGINGAVVDSVAGAQSAPGRDGIAGLQTSAALPGGVDVSGEYAIRRYTPERPGRRSPADGHAGYAVARKTLGPLSMLLEGKDWLRFKTAYTNPPTAIRQHTSTFLNRGSHVPNIRLDDERGYQFETLVTVTPQILFTGNLSGSEARHADLPAWEHFGQIEADALGAHWTGFGAKSEEITPEGGDPVYFERITFGGGWVRELGRSWGTDLEYETQDAQESNRATAAYEFPVRYRGNIVNVTLSKSPVHSWAATMEWTNDPREARKSWLWLEWNIRLGVIGQLTVGGGRLRGGQVCSGGVCKIVDPFEGGRLELLTNF